MINNSACVALFYIAFGFFTPSHAQHGNHGNHSGHGAPATAVTTPAAKAFGDANARMHKAMSIPLTGNADVDFVRGMIPHHQGAVEMAEIILKFGKDHAIRALADTIIKDQKAEISQMQSWLTKNSTLAPQPEAAAIKAAFNAANNVMHRDMSISFSNNPDKDFLRGMIPHHEAALGMAKIVQQYGKDAEIQKLAAAILASQSTEITQMRSWLADK